MIELKKLNILRTKKKAFSIKYKTFLIFFKWLTCHEEIDTSLIKMDLLIGHY